MNAVVVTSGLDDAETTAFFTDAAQMGLTAGLWIAL